VDGVFIWSADRGAQPLARERRAEALEERRLAGSIEMTALLPPTETPPTAHRLIEGLDGLEGDPPLVSKMKDHFREVIPQCVVVAWFEIVAAADRSGDAAAVGHPVGRGIGKRLHRVHARCDRGLQHPTLVGVGGPIPDPGPRLKAGNGGSVFHEVVNWIFTAA